MKIEEQVLTIEQMQHLKELGVEVQDEAFAWCIDYKDVLGNMLKEPVRSLLIEPPTDKEDLDKYEGWSTIIPTLTLQEILEMLPENIWVEDDEYTIETVGKHYIGYSNNGHVNFLHDIWKKRMIDSAYGMFCWVAENGHLNTSNSMPLNKE